jgi:hypothetical protein
MENYNRVERTEDGVFYYLNDELHRIDGPAEDYFDGTKYWWLNGKLHRIGGPAIEYFDGTKYWIQNGKFHRLDGPAVEWSYEHKEWYYEDKNIDCKSQEEFERIIKLKLFW